MNNYQRIYDYAKHNYKAMLREPDGLLKYRYIVPGSVYSDSLWDWDSWLTNVALKQFVKEDISEYERGCILNYLEAMDSFGRIPVCITPKKYLPNISKSDKMNIHKPCLAQHTAFLIKSDNGNAEWFRPYFPKLKKFVDYYINNLRHENGLYFWVDDNAIGVDNDPSTFFRPKCSSASIFLNCFMYKELEAVCYIGKLLNENTDFYESKKQNLYDAIQKNCYDEKDGFFYSADLNLLPVNPDAKLHSGAPRHWDCLIQRIGSWSGFLALWSGIATQPQAERIVKENLLDKNAFWAPYGVRSLSKYEKMYAVKASGNPSCWLGPVWGISNYLVFEGLIKYGFTSEAEQLAQKTVELFGNDIKESGELHEYYDPESGAPIINAGFQNWNLLSLNMDEWLKGKDAVFTF